MQLQLTGLKSLVKKNMDQKYHVEGFRRLKVEYCAICKTDAKMWHEGHRDLVLPRVPGHEIAASDAEGNRFAVWPGQSCGNCVYCLTGRENLCEKMKVMGFHRDGGFADYIYVPQSSILAVPNAIETPLICFAEPVGCILNVLEKIKLTEADRVIIYGAGTMGLLTALICKSSGAVPLLIEKDERKIQKALNLTHELDITCVKASHLGEFQVAVNACPDPAAFAQCIVKLAKGGRLGFFSGITKNKNLETNLLNLLHYKELTMVGSYGLTRKNMQDGLNILKKKQDQIKYLVEDIVAPENAPNLMPEVLAGHGFRYLLDFSRKPGRTVSKPTSEDIIGSSGVKLSVGSNRECIDASLNVNNCPAN